VQEVAGCESDGRGNGWQIDMDHMGYEDDDVVRRVAKLLLSLLLSTTRTIAGCYENIVH